MTLHLHSNNTIITYFLRPEKKGALDFKNQKLKKYCYNLYKLNWINSSNLFPIGYNLFCSSKYHSFWEIKILKTVNKLYFVQKWEKVGKFCLICLHLYFMCIFLRGLQIWEKLLSLIFPITIYCLFPEFDFLKWKKT